MRSGHVCGRVSRRSRDLPVVRGRVQPRVPLAPASLLCRRVIAATSTAAWPQRASRQSAAGIRALSGLHPWNSFAPESRANSSLERPDSTAEHTSQPHKDPLTRPGVPVRHFFITKPPNSATQHPKSDTQRHPATETPATAVPPPQRPRHNAPKQPPSQMGGLHPAENPARTQHRAAPGTHPTSCGTDIVRHSTRSAAPLRTIGVCLPSPRPPHAMALRERMHRAG